MRRVTAALLLALAICVVGYGALTQRGAQVPLPTDETAHDGACVLLFQVVDVIANPTSGTPSIASTDAPLMWPKGYTAWRVGSEVEVLDATGNSVLTTGGRYWMCPSKYLPQWVIGDVKRCPDCKLESGVL